MTNPALRVSIPPTQGKAGVHRLAEALSVQAERKVQLRSRVRDARARWLRLALQTAETNLAAHLAGKQTVQARLQALPSPSLSKPSGQHRNAPLSDAPMNV